MAIKHKGQKWRQVVFSDETTFQMFQNTQKVFYKVGTQPPQKPMVKHPYKVHAWGAFSAKGPIGLCLFTGIMDGAFYREILTENLFDNANTVMGRRWIFMQDNDPKHKATEMMNLLKQKCPKLLDWPSNSPDLNPIENLWAIIKRDVELRRPKNLSELECFLEEEWAKIPNSLLINLVNSMPRRCEEVIEKNGERISY